MRALALLLVVTGCRGIFGIQDVTPQDAGPDQRCVEGDVCSMPPPPECVSGNTLRTYDMAGTCTGNECRYTSRDEICVATCENGACVCPDGADNWPVDVPVGTVSATITVGGVPVTSSSGSIYLRTPAGDEYFVGYTSTSNVTFRVVPGTYDIHYEYTSTCGTTIPCNRNARLRTVMIPAGPSSLAIDVPVAQVTVNTTVGGVPLTSASDYGVLTFRTTSGDQLTIGPTNVPSTSVKVVAGTYEIRYDGDTTCGPMAPCNQNAFISSVALAPGPSTLNIDVPVATVTRNVTIAGVPITSASDYGVLSLRTASGDRFSLGPTNTTSSTHRLVPGTYSLIYARGVCGAATPCNMLATLQVVTLPPGPSTLNIDVPTSTLTRNVTVAGVPLPDASDFGSLYLRTPGGDEVTLGETYMLSSTRIVTPGTYDVYYVGSPTYCLPNAPCNSNAKLTSVTIAPGVSTIGIDVPVATVTRNVRINGLAVSAFDDYGSLYLRTDVDELAIGQTYSLSSTFKVVAGAYDVHYEGTGCLPITPCNQRAKVQTITLAPGPSTLDINVPLRVITRHATIGGVPVTDTSAVGNLFLRSASGDELVLDRTDVLSTIHRLVPGTYNVIYEAVTCTRTAPCNERALLGCVKF